MRHTALGCLVAVMTGCVASASLADDGKSANEKKWRADAGRGERLAEKICAGCHVVSADQTRAAIAGVPSFRAIANLPGRTDEHISGRLIRPHAPMPNAQLTQHEIGDLLAYFRVLRAHRPGKTGQPDGIQQKPKPVYPSPS